MKKHRLLRLLLQKKRSNVLTAASGRRFHFSFTTNLWHKPTTFARLMPA
jgi:hypothetical protein